MKILYEKSNPSDQYLQDSLQIGPEEAKDFLAASLYHKGKLSQRQAGQLINKDIREFLEVLERYGFPISGETSDEDISWYNQSLQQT